MGVVSGAELDAARIARAIGFTQFPYSLSADENEICGTSEGFDGTALEER